MKIQNTSVQDDHRTTMPVVGTDEAKQHTVAVPASTSDRGTVALLMYTIGK